MKHLSIRLSTVWSLFIGMMQLVPWRSEELLAWNSRKPKSWLVYSGSRSGTWRWRLKEVGVEGG